MANDRRRAAPEERPPRLRLIRVFLSILVSFMAGLVGWTAVMMSVLLRYGTATTARLPQLPPALHIIAFAVPALVAGYWFFTLLGSPH